MKLQKALIASFFVLAALTGCSADKTAIIKVNDGTITKGQFEEAYKKEANSPSYAPYATMLKDKDSMLSLMLKDKIVNELILRAIVEQEIQKRNIEVQEDEVELRKQEIAEKIGSKENLNDILSKNGISEKEFNEDVTKELRVEKLVKSIKDTNVSDAEVSDFYKKNTKMFDYPDRVRASHILIEVNPNSIKQEIISSDKKGTLTAEEIDKKTQEAIDAKMTLAKEVRAKAVQNPDQFEALAKQYSDDKVSAEHGGDLGFFTKDSMVKPFSDAAFKLKPGTVSEVVVTDFGNHIIIVKDRAKAGVQPFEKVKDEIRAYLEQTKKVNALSELLEGLRASAKVEYVDPEYDPAKIQQEISDITKQQQKELSDKYKDKMPNEGQAKPLAAPRPAPAPAQTPAPAPVPAPAPAPANK